MAYSTMSPKRNETSPLLIRGVLAAVVILAVAGVAYFVFPRPKPTYPRSGPGVVPQGMTREQAEDAMVKASLNNAFISEALPSWANSGLAIARGVLVGRDPFHKGEGAVTIYRTSQGILVRLEPFKVTNGPELHVILTGHPNPTGQPDVIGFKDVGKLKANIGSQNFMLPADISLDPYRAVVIYDVKFGIVFAVAPLQHL